MRAAAAAGEAEAAGEAAGVGAGAGAGGQTGWMGNARSFSQGPDDSSA